MKSRGKYQFWLCDDQGNRLALLDEYSFFSYSRSCIGYGTIEIGMPHKYIIRPRISFQPDWRIDVWRRSSDDTPFRREGSFLLRKYILYERASDGMLMIVYYGRSPIDILRRFGSYRLNFTNQKGEDGNIEDYTYAWDDPSGLGNIPTLMNEIGNGFFTQWTNFGVTPSYDYRGYLGPENFEQNLSAPKVSNYYTFGKQALEILTELRESSFTQNELDSSVPKVYFDVVEVELPVAGAAPAFQYVFRVYVGLRGVDRTKNGPVFSTENGNLANPVLSEDWLDEINAVIMHNISARISTVVSIPTMYTASGMNKCYKLIQSSSTKVADLKTEARALLKKNGVMRTISAEFMDSPGDSRRPRSLYGLDWDLGDQVNVRFAGLTLKTEILIVYVSMGEDGIESVAGRNQVGS